MAVDKKVKTFIGMLNKCEPVRFLHHRFHHFCQDMFFDDWEESSPYCYEESYIEISKYIADKFPLNLDLDTEELEIRVRFLSFSIFIFRSYLVHCLEVTKLSKPGMKRFCDSLRSEFIEGDLSRLVNYYSYFKRDDNRDMEMKKMDELKGKFNFFDDLANVDFVYATDYEESPDDDEVMDISKFIKDSYIYFMEGILICFSHLLSHFENLIFIENMGLQ